MCGILGSVNYPFDDAVLNIIRHRGPDGSGIANFSVGGNAVCLGQRRLAILDLSAAGHQPMFTECGQHALIFNGEIYNHLELRKMLPSTIDYKGHSDTETILHLFSVHGIGALRYLNGIFALAYLDRSAGVLYLARDPFGVKPLYYHLNADKHLIFSSEMRPIRAMLNKDAGLCIPAMATLLRLRYNPAPDTIQESVKKVRPGHFIGIGLTPGSMQIFQQSFLHPVPETKPAAVPAVTRDYGRRLEEAVTRQLLSDVEVGVLLSGGIDSALVAALAQKHSPAPLKAFTIGFEGQNNEDEIEDASETAALLGLDHRYRKITFNDFLAKLEECARIVEEPLATTSMIPMYFLAEMASRHVKVVLTGQGADEPLGGYPRYRSELILQKIPLQLQGLLGSLFRTGSYKNESLQRGLTMMGIGNETDRFLAAYQIFSNPEIKELITVPDHLSREHIRYFADLLKCGVKKHPAERMMALDARMNLADDLLTYTDKITMNFSLECRVPMLDLELVSYIESLPCSQKLNFRSGKLVHRRFAESLLPGRIIHRKKKPFRSPTRSWFRTNSDEIRDILLTGGSRFAEIFDQASVRKIIEQHELGFNREKQLFLLLNIFYCLKALDSETAPVKTPQPAETL